jgi:cell wall-associated NlpC family hydrolase
VAARTRIFRRHAAPAVVLAAVLALVATLVTPIAAAQSLGGLQAQASQLEARIQSLGMQEAGLSERYDGARYALSQTEAKVAKARKGLQAALAAAGRARGVLRTEAIDAYVSGSGGSGATVPLSSANQSLLRAEYEQTLANSQADAMDAYETASLGAATAGRLLRAQEQHQTADLRSIAADKAQVQASADRLGQLLASDKGRIGAIIAAQQAAQLRAAQRAAQLRIQTERQTAAASAAARQSSAQQSSDAVITGAVGTSTTTGSTTGSGGGSGSGSGGGSESGGGSGAGSGSGGGSGFTPPASSSAAAVAVAAAESRVGDPYVWGAAGPSSFDCSGLVMWAYEQAGIQLPHFSGAQYADTVHIPLADIQPGDLLFFSNPDIHVAMYVGNGMIIQAPYTGADVQIVPMYPELTLASRVE